MRAVHSYNGCSNHTLTVSLWFQQITGAHTSQLYENPKKNNEHWWVQVLIIEFGSVGHLLLSLHRLNAVPFVEPSLAIFPLLFLQNLNFQQMLYVVLLDTFK